MHVCLETHTSIDIEAASVLIVEFRIKSKMLKPGNCLRSRHTYANVFNIDLRKWKNCYLLRFLDESIENV